MSWKKIICWLKGHEYRLIMVKHHHPVKKEFIYQCTRCGHRTKFRNQAELFAEMICRYRVKKAMEKGL